MTVCKCCPLLDWLCMMLLTTMHDVIKSIDIVIKMYWYHVAYIYIKNQDIVPILGCTFLDPVELGLKAPHSADTELSLPELAQTQFTPGPDLVQTWSEVQPQWHTVQVCVSQNAPVVFIPRVVTFRDQAVIGAKYIHKYIHQSEGSERAEPTHRRGVQVGVDQSGGSVQSRWKVRRWLKKLTKILKLNKNLSNL